MAVRMEPRIVERVKEVVLMGGGYHVGNWSAVAEVQHQSRPRSRSHRVQREVAAHHGWASTSRTKRCARPPRKRGLRSWHTARYVRLGPHGLLPQDLPRQPRFRGSAGARPLHGRLPHRPHVRGNAAAALLEA